ncbi:calcium-binding protein [Herbaspirillum huttiense]|uniref:calcium-binding protein n=1 Tax=Herbaspirillum huttiense TaxID=863372 RepID=UPI0023EA6465|nr:calcium-binding protein [Herbaspirillum huttiense]
MKTINEHRKDILPVITLVTPEKLLAHLSGKTRAAAPAVLLGAGGPPMAKKAEAVALSPAEFAVRGSDNAGLPSHSLLWAAFSATSTGSTSAPLAASKAAGRSPGPMPGESRPLPPPPSSLASVDVTEAAVAHGLPEKTALTPGAISVASTQTAGGTAAGMAGAPAATATAAATATSTPSLAALVALSPAAPAPKSVRPLAMSPAVLAPACPVAPAPVSVQTGQPVPVYVPVLLDGQVMLCPIDLYCPVLMPLASLPATVTRDGTTAPASASASTSASASAPEDSSNAPAVYRKAGRFDPGSFLPQQAFSEGHVSEADSRNEVSDRSWRILDARLQGVTAAQLAALDGNRDGELSGAELSGLMAWSDANQDGIGQPGEISALADALQRVQRDALRATDYGIFTAGNARLQASAPEENPPVPPSNYRTLRDNDNSMSLPGGGVINFRVNQFKIVSSAPGTLIGTDGADLLSAGNNGLDYALGIDPARLNTLLAGDGDDKVFGRNGADILWAGNGNDSVNGFGGNDRIYGEDGDDQLSGGEGDDLIDGGAGNDSMFGGWGNDRLYGGDGDDTLMGNDIGNASLFGLTVLPSDDDVIFGGAGNDSLMGNGGNDQLRGGTGNDKLYGGEGNDQLHGEEGNDQLTGGNGDDILYGGDGNDYLVGSDIRANWLEPLPASVVGNDKLHGGAGDDTLITAGGDDYLDGGAGNDHMEGGSGNDTYVVSSPGDVVLERDNGGYDTVLAGSSYALTEFVEELHLLDGGNYNAGGNGLDNLIVGNSQDNVIDGATGADTMIGGKGSDSYFIDNPGDKVIELAGEGIDTVYSRISTTLGENVENLVLLDAGTPQRASMDGKPVLVYGAPHDYHLDYDQGGDIAGYDGTCGEASIANLLTIAGQSVSEPDVLRRAIQMGWCTPKNAGGMGGGTNVYERSQILDSYHVAHQMFTSYEEQKLLDALQAGRGAIIGVCSSRLWGHGDNGSPVRSDHVITLTGMVCDEATGVAQGVYITDSGQGNASDMCRFLTMEQLRYAANVDGANALITVAPIKMTDASLNGSGNALDNQLVGNRGNNILTGGRGDDTLVGQAGSDTYVFSRGDGQDLVADNDATKGNLDTLQFTDIRQTSLWFRHVGNDLQIDVLGGQDQITIKDWYVGGASGSDNHIERIRTAEGYTLYDSDVEKLVQAMASFAPPAATQTEWRSGDSSADQVLLTVTH